MLPSSSQAQVSHHRDGFWVVSFPVEFARAQPAEIRRAGDQVISDLAKEKPPHCVIDLSGMQTLGSALVAVLVRIWKFVSQTEGQMVVVAPSVGQREVLRVTGLNNIWTIAPSLEAGIHALGYSKEAKVVKRERRLLVMVSAFSLLNAAAAVTIRMLPELEGYTQPSNTLVFSILGLTVLTSTICLFRESGWRLWLSILVFLSSLALSGTFIWHTHYRLPAGSGATTPADAAADQPSADQPAGAESPGAMPDSDSESQGRTGSLLPAVPPPGLGSKTGDATVTGSSVTRQPRTPDLPSTAGSPSSPAAGTTGVAPDSGQDDSSDDSSGEAP